MSKILSSLRTLKNWGALAGLSPAGVHKALASGRIKAVEIDGVKFIDLVKFPPSDYQKIGHRPKRITPPGQGKPLTTTIKKRPQK